MTPIHSVTATYDVAVFGSTPCSIAAALAAAGFGRKVALICGGLHLGGMMSSGLSITDLRFTHAFGGIFRAFADKVLDYYTERYGSDSQQVKDCNGGIWFEPHVAETVFEQMLSEFSSIDIFRDFRLSEALTEGGSLKEIRCVHRASGETQAFRAGVFIDGSYEGDLAAAAGVKYRVGREGREAYREPYAGFIFLKNPGLQVLEGSTGIGDNLIQAYNYRLCLTNRPDVRVAPQKPDAYDREEYVPLIALVRDGDVKQFNDVIRLAPIPNGKFNGNNRLIPVSLDLPEANTRYPEADEEGRAAIIARYRSYMTGLLWFLQHDAELPAAFREEAVTWGFCSDEFAGNGHVPYELYVREARRIVGKKTFTSLDAFLAPGSERTPIHDDSVAVGDYHVDSHIVQRKQPGWPQIEGHVYLRPISRPAHIPYGVIVPEGIEDLLVPGALSATHLGFSVLRMEPPWMALGQAAGTAAHLALQQGTPPSAIEVKRLQQLLLDSGQVISFFYDVPGPDPVWWALNLPGERTRLDSNAEIRPPASCNKGLQYFCTKGFFSTYHARPYDPVTRSEAARWLYAYLDMENPEWKTGDNGEQWFDDMDESHPDAEMAGRLRAAGIIEPWLQSSGFYPGAALSRKDVWRWIAKTAAYLQGAGPGGDKTDPAAEEWMRRIEARHLPLRWRKDWGLNDLFYATREEFCELLYNIHMADE
ncbi:FAD-dependent oxidoreductase [Paenibacillus thalictri]|uniref:FAD-dependent oxidoreductase n=1 Tax=Paenibacillus thalictri TaxID=2527873 RepID=A0A4Q9DIX1_9BACL|nr:FAD-dependent oxidoreductase [Paenibacillus thalictri]TBL73324.1 FAD-dependent oxidoreductase [Paenibacillus thalictri]